MKAQGKTVKAFSAALLAAAMVLISLTAASANADPSRVVVLPFYSEEGYDAKDGGDITIHYRRMMGYINNQLVRHGFDVVSPFARDAMDSEYNRVMEIAREDSPKAAVDVCRKYGVDAAIITWLRVKVRKTEDGLCQAKATLEGEAYDSGGSSLGLSIRKTWKRTKADCDDAIAEAEIEVGDEVGRKLTAWSGRKTGKVVTPRPAPPADGGAPVVDTRPAAPAGSVEGGALKKNIKKAQQFINIRLDGVTEYEVVEAFGKVVKTVRGVEYAKNYGQKIVVDNPQASYVIWRATVSGTDAFVLQANIVKMLNDISDSGGEIVMKGVPYRYTAAEIDLLKGVHPANATTREIQFILNRQLVRDREMSERHDPYKAREKQGFE